MANTKEEVQPAVPTEPESPAPQGTPTDLNINDLVAVRNIIDVASQRGAFKAAELEAVGKAFNKLNSFLEAVAPKEEAPATEE